MKQRLASDNEKCNRLRRRDSSLVICWGASLNVRLWGERRGVCNLEVRLRAVLYLVSLDLGGRVRAMCDRN